MYNDVIIWTGDVGTTYLVNEFLKSKYPCTILFCLFKKSEIEWAQRFIELMQGEYPNASAEYDYCCAEFEGMDFSKEAAIVLGFINTSLKTDGLHFHVGFNEEDMKTLSWPNLQNAEHIVESWASIDYHHIDMLQKEQIKELGSLADECHC